MLDVQLPQSLHHLPASDQHLDFLYPPILPARTPGPSRLPRAATGHCDPPARLAERVTKDLEHRRQPGTLQTLRLRTATPASRVRRREDLKFQATGCAGPTEFVSNKPAEPTPAMSGAHGLSTSHFMHHGSYNSTAGSSRNYDAVLHNAHSNSAYSSYQAQSINKSRSRPASPIFYEPLPSSSDTASRTAYSHNAIASYLQIPSSISTNKGSLAELAAQVGIR